MSKPLIIKRDKYMHADLIGVGCTTDSCTGYQPTKKELDDDHKLMAELKEENKNA